MSFSKRQGNDAVCYTKPLDSLKSWNDRFFWVDAFACLASFPWNTSKSASKDPFPKSSQYNAEHYATLVAYPAPFHKYPEPFLCLIGISRNYTLDEDTYPQFLRDNNEGEGLVRQRAKGTKVCLDTTVGRVVPLLPVAPARASSELEANVDKLFDEGGSGSHAEQGDSQPRRQRKRKTVVSDAVNHTPPKKLREDHGTSTGPSVAGKSRKNLSSLLFVGGFFSGSEHTVCGFFWPTGSRLHCWRIRTVVSPDTDLQKVYVPQWSVTNGSCLDDGRTCREMVDEFAPPKFFASIRGMEHDELIIGLLLLFTITTTVIIVVVILNLI
ncbi:hypothetical protein Tco_0513276 [Tanacetum coccineum]